MSATQKHTLVLFRDSPSENTVAVVSFTCEENLTEGKALDRFRRAVTAWISETETGKNALANSVWDFNVGDLWTWIGDVAPYLEKEGLTEVNITTASSGSCDRYAWTFDALLFDEDTFPRPDHRS